MSPVNTELTSSMKMNFLSHIHSLLLFLLFIKFSGEFLEILDDSRKWWKARNSQGLIAHVPHTIVTEVAPRREAHGSPTSEDWIRKQRQGKKGEFRYF